MISPEIIHVNYIKKEAQTGSYCGMRYRLSKGKNEEGDCMASIGELSSGARLRG